MTNQAARAGILMVLLMSLAGGAVADLPGDDRIWPGLATLARDDSRSDAVREAAMFWLARVDDPRAVDMLESILLD